MCAAYLKKRSLPPDPNHASQRLWVNPIQAIAPCLLQLDEGDRISSASKAPDLATQGHLEAIDWSSPVKCHVFQKGDR